MSASCSRTEGPGRPRIGWSFGVCVALVVGCATPLTLEEERDLSERARAEVLADKRLLADPVVDDYVARIGESLVRAAGPQPFSYQFYVVEDDSINAAALPAGHILIHTGTILNARNVSELAGVLAHEVGHVVKRHVANNYNRQRSTGLATWVLANVVGAASGGYAGNAAGLLGGLLGQAYLSTYTREAEEEADAFAVEIMPRAGLDPRGLVTFFYTMGQEGGGPRIPLLASHPAGEDRIAATSALIDRMDLPPGLRMNDGGKFEIVQQRVRLLTGTPTEFEQ